MEISTHVALLARIDILPGFEQEVLAAAQTVCVETRKEKGCLAFNLNTVKNASAIIFYEVFESAAGFDFHRDAPHTMSFLQSLIGKVEGDGPQLTFLNKYID